MVPRSTSELDSSDQRKLIDYAAEVCEKLKE